MSGKFALQTSAPARATIADVAIEAGVSKAAVSQILNGKGRASEATRAQVIAAAQRIGYGANPIARSLRTGRTGVLGIVFRPSDAISGSIVGTEFHIRVAGGAATRALSLGYGLLHLPDTMRVADIQYPMDGCVVVAPFGSDEYLAELSRRGLPKVLIDTDPDFPDAHVSVGRDEAGAMDQLLTQLTGQGVQSTVLLSITDDNAWRRGFEASYRVWCDRCGVIPRIIKIDGLLGSDGARATVQQLIAERGLPDAIIGATSRFAVGAAAALAEAHVDVPGDVMVAALSDSELTRSHHPPITALDLHGDAIGREAIMKLVGLIKGQADIASSQIGATLKVRSSTLRLPSGSPTAI